MYIFAKSYILAVVCLALLLFTSGYSQGEQGNLSEPKKSIAEETQRQAAHVRGMAISFSRDPQLANQVVSFLGDWPNLSKHKGLEAYSREAEVTDTQGPLLAALDHCRANLTTQSLNTLYNYSFQRMKEKALPVQERYVALKVTCRTTSELQSRNMKSLQGADASDDDQTNVPVAPKDLEAFLRELTVDNTEDIQLRRVAVKNLGAFRCVSSSEILASIAEDGKPDNPVTLRKTALLALPTLDPERALDISSNMLATTEDKDMFSAAALVLGRSKTTRGLETLVNNASKCPPDSLAIRAAVRYHREWVAQELKNPLSDKLLLALQALPHCQSSRDDLFKPDLINLLQTCDLEKHQKIAREILQRLVTAKLMAPDCRQILEILSKQSFDASSLCPDEYAYFERLARSVEVQESTREVRK